MSSRKKVAVSSFVQSGNFEISSQAGFGHVEHTVIPQYYLNRQIDLLRSQQQVPKTVKARTSCPD